ncbi:unnamed protein product [Protopolystoma xenopodis]|uniref:Uncharacterized protein n=1 Tax=Protopolystoma xenopodis TaxID=117903 RepID=A0A3S5B3U4_9PLAT|nr:unnamed protein product [Protopolystoma xenopodis]
MLDLSIFEAIQTSFLSAVPSAHLFSLLSNLSNGKTILPVQFSIRSTILQLVKETSEADSFTKHGVWCATLSGSHDTLQTPRCRHQPLHSCPGNVDQSLPYCYAVFQPQILSQSLSCPIRSVCSLPGSRISLDPCHPICATEGVIRHPLRLGDQFKAQASE